jgi:endonuclease IV
VLTKANTTLEALTQALALLKRGGAVSICFYPGHEGGALEYETVTAYAKTLDPKAYDVLHCTFFNKAENGPKILFIQKF